MVLKFDKMQLSARDTVNNPSDLADIFFKLMEINAKEISTNCTAYSCRIAEVGSLQPDIIVFLAVSQGSWVVDFIDP
jgi:hypothetical protein